MDICWLELFEDEWLLWPDIAFFIAFLSSLCHRHVVAWTSAVAVMAAMAVDGVILVLLTALAVAAA